ncbi:hypothetical protein MLD38_039379 [Melastoma candidum]|uniref:Uncharacterized protein n=1 Tax=Melastoma candidum TaxID=119954 RepID=A0ACB9L3D6_9MYRT|nr:hypothetical protein MLD38_039379 [Melastoma candidum]
MALHRASFKGHMDVVRILIEKGIGIDTKDMDGYSALRCTTDSGHTDVVALLVKKGADVGSRKNKDLAAPQIVESLRLHRHQEEAGTPRRNQGVSRGDRRSITGIMRRDRQGSIRNIYSIPFIRNAFKGIHSHVNQTYYNSHA